MSYISNTDNIYTEGMLITAKAYPDQKLMIMKYYHRIYYCAVVGDSHSKHMAYFERELLPPVA
jgi:hypothetical protein